MNIKASAFPSVRRVVRITPTVLARDLTSIGRRSAGISDSVSRVDHSELLVEPVECCWDSDENYWINDTVAARVLGLVKHDGEWTFASPHEAETLAWIQGIQTAMNVLGSYCSLATWGPRLPRSA